MKLNWGAYAAEACGTAFNVFVGLSAGVINFSPDFPIAHMVPSSSLRLLLTGLIFAGSGSLFAISPLGKLSGAHINPSMSLAFYLRGKMHLFDLFGYILAQLMCQTLGATLLVVVWGKYAAQIRNGMTLPESGLPLWMPLLAEVILPVRLSFAVFVLSCITP